MLEAASILNIEAPDLYLRQSPVRNAYTMAISRKKPFVVVHTSLVELLPRKDSQAVLAHELGHLKCDHGLWLTFANILGMYTSFTVLGRAFPPKPTKGSSFRNSEDLQARPVYPA